MKTNQRHKNISELLKQKLPPRIISLIRKIGAIGQDHGFPAYLVGGFIRDLLLGADNLDLDIVVEGDGLRFASLLQERIVLKVTGHKRFGTATITLPSGFKIDLASARRESYAHPAALPSVSQSSIKEDLFRRDFTINALAMAINRDDFGRLLDLLAGQQDLIKKKIRVLHDRSFIDDPTRIIRAIRFAQRYNFS
ncbi:hypothetical protein ACFL2I_00360, partial [Candidatus Omnitrophota bacterium]